MDTNYTVSNLFSPIPEGHDTKITFRRAKLSGYMNTYHYNLNHYELICITEGQCKCCLSTKVHLLEGTKDKFSIAIMKKGESHHHSYDKSNYHSIYHIFFNDEYLENFRQRSGQNLIELIDNKLVLEFNKIDCMDLLNTIEALYKSSETYDYMQLLLTDLFFLNLIKFIPKSTEIPEYKGKSQGIFTDTVLSFIRYIDDNYKEQLTLKIVSDNFYLNKEYLSRLFKSKTGMTITDYINSVRIKKACELLENTSLDVGFIAYSVGFGSATHFDRQFKKQLKITPKEYRKSKK
ncbi:MAG: AraC family transcriptional regulator [Bacillota bacterium]|nr:AraC family transcriptional regulator [Bacillota bacterium]